MTALLRDYKPENVEAARRLAAELGLTKSPWPLADAFDRSSLASIEPRPTIGVRLRAVRIVSGERRRPCFVARIGRCDRARRLPRLHESAVAPAGGVHCSGAAQPGR